MALAFDANVDLESASERLSAFLQAFTPADGLAVRAARGSRQEVLGARFTRTSSVSAKQLARGGTLELGRRHFEPTKGRCAEPIFWISSRDPEDDESPLLQFGACLERPPAAGAAEAIAEALRLLVEACVDLEGCISALVLAQSSPTSLSSPVFDYEMRVGTTGEGESAKWLRSHVRAPGWLVLVPKAGARALKTKAPAGVSAERVRSGLLAQCEAATPHEVKSLAPLEKWLSPVLGVSASSEPLARR